MVGAGIPHWGGLGQGLAVSGFDLGPPPSGRLHCFPLPADGMAGMPIRGRHRLGGSGSSGGVDSKRADALSAV